MTIEEKALELFPNTVNDDYGLQESAQKERRRIWIAGVKYAIDEWFKYRWVDLIKTDPRYELELIKREREGQRAIPPYYEDPRFNL